MHFLKAIGMWNAVVRLKRWVVESFFCLLQKKTRKVRTKYIYIFWIFPKMLGFIFLKLCLGT